MKKKIPLLFLATIFLFLSSASFAQDGVPSTLPPTNIGNINLVSQDFLGSATLKGRTNYRDLRWAGWATNKVISTWADVVQGLYESWSLPNRLFLGIKYGYFDNPLDAEQASYKAIGPWLRSSYITLPLPGSFSGVEIGEKAFRWELSQELSKGVVQSTTQKDTIIISFSKGKYAAMLILGSDYAQVGSIDKGFIETLAKKCETKINIAISLDAYNEIMKGLVLQQGILRSLQVKIDNFVKNYRMGEYKTALNNINAFSNEITAQRGKHVSEATYQTLKAYADAIVISLNSLM